MKECRMAKKADMGTEGVEVHAVVINAKSLDFDHMTTGCCNSPNFKAPSQLPFIQHFKRSLNECSLSEDCLRVFFFLKKLI